MFVGCLCGWGIKNAFVWGARCASEEPVPPTTWLVVLLFTFSVAVALIWLQFTLTTLVLIAAGLSRKAQIKQGISPYSNLDRREGCSNLCAFLSAPRPPSNFGRNIDMQSPGLGRLPDQAQVGEALL